MISTTDAAKLLGVSVQYLRLMAAQGRVPGAVRIGEGRRANWVFPPKPEIIRK